MVKKAMIMAAGVGSRLDPLTKTTPKPLIPIANQPVMDLLLKHISQFGVEEVVANTYCLADDIHKRYENYQPNGVKCTFIKEEELSGTAGGVKKCEFFFKEGETFIVMSGDGLTNVNLEEMIKAHKESESIVTMGLTEVSESEVVHFGVVVTDENNKVSEFQEKPTIEEAKSNCVNTGIYIFETEIFKYIPANTFYDFAKNVFPTLMANNIDINTHVIKEYWSDIGTLNQYRLSSTDVLEGRAYVEGTVITCTDNGMVLIGEDADIDENAELLGNNIIGNNCVIKSGAKLTDCIIWDNVVIEENVILDNCIIANDVKIESNAIIQKDSVVAAGSCVNSNGDITNELQVAK